MLDTAEVDRIVNSAVLGALKKRQLRRVFSEPTFDSQGSAALRVVVVLTDGAVEGISDDAALDTIVGIRQGLDAAGEHRFPIIDFATETELGQDADH